MSWISGTVESFLEGLGDSLDFAHTLKHLTECKIAKWSACYSLVLNGLLLVVCFYLLDTSILKGVLSVKPKDVFMNAFKKVLVNTRDTTSDEHLASASTFLDQAFWVVIFHKLSVAVNIRFFRKLTEASLEHVNISVTSEKNAKVSAGRDALYRVSLIGFTFMQGIVLQMLMPVVGELFAFVIFCWVNAYYSFETVWDFQGLLLPQQLALLERHPAYFMGFGVPLSFISHFLPHLLGHILLALVFPFFIIQAVGSNWAQPSKAQKKFGPSKVARLPIFKFSMWGADLVTQLFVRIFSRSGTGYVRVGQSKKKQ